MSELVIDVADVVVCKEVVTDVSEEDVMLIACGDVGSGCGGGGGGGCGGCCPAAWRADTHEQHANFSLMANKKIQSFTRTSK